jgi:hypothetical protein
VTVTYWALADPDSASRANPYALVREVRENGGLRFDIWRGGTAWEDRSPSLVWIRFDPTSGDAYEISELAAAALRRDPPEKLRRAISRVA